MTARLTHEHSVGQGQARVLPSAARTGLASGKETSSLDDGDAYILGHVGENTPKLPERRVTGRTRETVVLEHALDVQILDDENRWTLIRDGAHRLVVYIPPYVCHLHVQPCDLHSRL